VGIAGEGMLPTVFVPTSSQALPSGRAGRVVRVTPIRRALRVASGRAPWALHLMSLVRTGTEAVITVVMRRHWPPDGSSADLEITGAGPHHLPYDQLGAVDEHETRCTVGFEGGQGGTAAWRGIALLSSVPPRGARRLDLVGDGTRLVGSRSCRRPRAAARPHRRVAHWVADRCLRALFCVAPRCSPLVFSLVGPQCGRSRVPPELRGMQEARGPLSSTQVSAMIRTSACLISNAW
jgi:hypothetical protein